MGGGAETLDIENRESTIRLDLGRGIIPATHLFIVNNHQEIIIMASSKRFEGKTAFITGAASGIGRATAVAFAAEGARVVVTDRDEAALQETAEHVKTAGAEVLAITCDVSKPEEIQAAIAQAVKTFGRIDCAFNNAGVENKATPLHEIELQEWDRILNINLRGTFVCMKHEIAQMVRQGGGVVVNTSSGAASAAWQAAALMLPRSTR